MTLCIVKNMTKITLLTVLLLMMVAACHRASTQSPIYGVKIHYAQGQPLTFPDVTLVFMGTRKSPASSEYPRSMIFYEFNVYCGRRTVRVSWTAGTGDIGPTLFELAGKRYTLELAMSDTLGSLDKDELVLWREVIPAGEAAAPTNANVLISQEYTLIDQEQYAIPLTEALDMPAVRERLSTDIDFAEDLHWDPFEHLTAYRIPDALMVVFAPIAEIGTYFVINPTEGMVIGTLRGNRLYGWFTPAAFQFWTTFALGGGSDLEGYAFYRWDGMTSVQHQYTILVEETSTQIPSEPNIDATVVTRQDGCVLRTTPEILQAYNIGSEEHLMCKTYGNIVAEFPKGSHGQALYEMRSKDGNLWYFVIMALHERAQSCYLYPGLKADSFAGWMNGECVQVQRTSAAGEERAANILRFNTQFEQCLRPILCCRQRRR